MAKSVDDTIGKLSKLATENVVFKIGGYGFNHIKTAIRIGRMNSTFNPTKKKGGGDTKIALKNFLILKSMSDD